MSGPCSSIDLDEQVLETPEAALERMYIEEYLAEKGHTLKSLRTPAKEEARKLMNEACRYATFKLAEVEARARLHHEIHGA
jgi:hypothetical protein